MRVVPVRNREVNGRASFYAIQAAYDALGWGIIKNALPQHAHSMLKTDMPPTATVLFYGGHCRHRRGGYNEVRAIRRDYMYGLFFI